MLRFAAAAFAAFSVSSRPLVAEKPDWLAEF
jgi:hypothetical protein